MKKEIRIFDLTFDEEFREKFFSGAKQILDEGFLANHTFVREFEQKFAEVCRAKYALGVTNGTSAIEIPLRALDVKGKEVILGTNTFIATAVAIENAGGIPVPVDIEDQHFSMSPEKLKEAITPETAAVVVIHIAGLVTPRMREIQAICREHDLPLVEDCAQAFGSEWNGIMVGNFGAAGAFSFHTTKLMTAGEGGMVITSDDKLYDIMRSVRQYGMVLTNPLVHERSGSNFKMTEFSALLGLCELDRRDKRIGQRQKLAHRYQERLKGSSWRTLMPAGGGTTGYYKQIVLSPVPRQEAAERFAKEKIALTGGVYFVPIHRQPIYQDQFRDEDYPVANYFAETHICPPCYPELNVEDIDRICDVLLDIKR